MGRAGQSLKHVLTQYGIRQRRLAITMGIECLVVSDWVQEVSAPPDDSLPLIVVALETLEPPAGSIFISMYLDPGFDAGNE